jgi:hypothetical protein
MEKIMKEYKVDEVAKLARSKVEAELLEGSLPKTRTDFEKAIKLLQKTKDPFIKFILRLDANYLNTIAPNFDTLHKLIFSLSEAQV